MPDGIDIRVFLSGSTKNKFIEIKENIGIENNTEIIRCIIHDYYRLYFLAHKALMKAFADGKTIEELKFEFDEKRLEQNGEEKNGEEQNVEEKNAKE